MNEDSLVNSLVHNNQSNVWDRAESVVEWLKSFLELLDLTCNDLVSHGFTDSISVDDDLVWIRPIVSLGISLDSISDASVQILLDKFLILGLNYNVAVN